MITMGSPGRWTMGPMHQTGYSVLGKRASSYEFNFANALNYFGFEYKFQVDYWGGRTVAGGMVLDFLVFTTPLPTPVWINGEYWHSGQRKDIDFLQQTLLAVLFNNQVAPPKTYWGVDVGTYETAKMTVRRDFA